MTGPNKVVSLSVASGGKQVHAGKNQEELSDAVSLLDRVRTNEPWAQRAFVEGYRNHVERVLIRILGWHSEIDDLAQEVFVRAFARAHELREPEPAARLVERDSRVRRSSLAKPFD